MIVIRRRQAREIGIASFVVVATQVPRDGIKISRSGVDEGDNILDRQLSIMGQVPFDCAARAKARGILASH